MKLNFTLKSFLARKEGWIFTLLILTVMFAGCYEFFSIDQPTEAYNNSSFDVHIVVKEDSGDNDWTVSDLQDIGLFGVLIPDGWGVADSIHFYIVSDSAAYNNDGYLRYSTELSTMLEDSVGSPDNYIWWGAKTTKDADMSFFDSLYFTVTINTDGQTGTFSLQYSVGDEDYWDRDPSDALSNPMPIQITQNPNTSVHTTNDIVCNVYPNPATDRLNIEMDWDFSTNSTLQVYNVSGALIKTIGLTETNNCIDISGLTTGTYILNIVSGQGSASRKIEVR